MFCMECGEQLPDNAKFCFKCGAKVDVESRRGKEEETRENSDLFSADLIASMGPGEELAKEIEKMIAEPENDPSALDKIFVELDPVVCHSEYYFLGSGNPMLGGFSVAANRNYVLRHISHFPNEDFILMDENGENERKLDIRINLHKAEYKYLLGFNTHGVWFMVRSQINERFLNVKFVCVDVVGNRMMEYPISHQHGTITDVYIFEDELCYLNTSVDGVQYLTRLTPNGETQLFETQKDETIFRISASSKCIAWGFTSKRDVKTSWRWNFYDRATQRTTQLMIPQDKDRPWVPLVEVVAVDLAKNIMYTSLSLKEQLRFNALEWAIAVREIKEPVENGILNYKDKQSAVWKVDRREHDFYFDGSVFLSVENPTELDRFDRFGTKYALGRTSSGACQNFLVTDKWVYVNYDARDMVRLPKSFAANHGLSIDNPEAFPIFGRNQNVKM